MAKYSKLNLKNIVIDTLEINEDLEFVEANRGGIWIEYEQNGTYGTYGKKYSPEYDKFIEAEKPTDIHGVKCESWTLNTITGMYEPPVEHPSILTQEKDDNGISWYWNEEIYQTDNSKGWELRTGPDYRPEDETCVNCGQNEEGPTHIPGPNQD